MSGAAFSLTTTADGSCLVARGAWTLADLPRPVADFRARLVDAAGRAEAWDLSAVEAVDSAGAILLWRAWGCAWPPGLILRDAHRPAFARVAAAVAAGGREPPPAYRRGDGLVWLGRVSHHVLRHLLAFVALFGQVALDLLYVLRHPAQGPWREVSANLYKSGVRALPVSALVGFLIGVVISYLSALQLKNFGADLFIINIIGISVIRELGPVLVAVLVAGRSGSAMTAQLGVMRVTEEVDALVTMGVSRTLRLVLPKVMALSIGMPLLVVWTSAAGLAGGAVSANLQLGINYPFFFEQLPNVVPSANYLLGVGKGWVFGVVISLIACHFGLQVKPNTESLSAHTTASVVTAITTVILVDAVFAIFTRNLGMPVL